MTFLLKFFMLGYWRSPNLNKTSIKFGNYNDLMEFKDDEIRTVVMELKDANDLMFLEGENVFLFPAE